MLYRLGLLVATLGSCLACNLVAADAFGLPKIAAGLLGALLMWQGSDHEKMQRTGIERPLLAFVLAYVASWLFSIEPRVGLVGLYSQPFHGVAALVPAILIFYAASASRRTGDRWEADPFKIAALIGIVGGLLCLADDLGYIGKPFDMTPNGRALGFMGSPIFMGAVLAVCFPTCFFLATQWEMTPWLGVGGALGCALGIMLCESRGPAIAAIAGVVGTCIADGLYRPRWRHLAIVGAGAVFFVAISGSRLRSDTGRLAVWKTAVRAGAARPLVGWGPDTFPIAAKLVGFEHEQQPSAHNDLLQAWATMGLPGLLALCWLWFAVLRGAFFDAVAFRPHGPPWWNRSAASFGTLVALYFVAKFNPVPPTAIYIVAAIVGSMGPRSWPVSGPCRRDTWETARAIGLAASIPVFLSLAAAMMHGIGIEGIRRRDLVMASNGLRLANEYDPSEVFFAAERFRLIATLAPNYDEAGRRELAKRALKSSGDVVLARPHDMNGLELLSNVEVWSAQYLGRDAVASFEAARR